MRRFMYPLAILWLLLFSLVIAIDNPLVELEPVPRNVWDTGFDKRDNNSSPVALLDHETFVWSSSNSMSLHFPISYKEHYANQGILC